MRSFYRDTISRIRVTNGAPDGYGNPTTTSTLTSITGCRVQPLTVEERTTADQNFSEVTHRVFAPINADVRVADFITWSGRTFKVHGEPQQTRSPFGAANHLVFEMYLNEG